MRTLYLIRHAQPESALGPRRCGCPDSTPLSEVGLEQARQLARWAEDKGLTAIFASPLSRAAQTAAILSGGRLPVLTEDELTELNSGAWAGLTFEEIRSRFPTIYEARGRHLGAFPPPGGESFLQAGQRMARCISGILSRSSGNIAVVAHGGINRGWLASLLAMSPDDVMSVRQPWGGITTVHIDEFGRYTVPEVGVQPAPVPSDLWIEQLLEAHCTPDHVQAHCRAVAACADELAQTTPLCVNCPLLRAAALLHDLVRTKPNHPQAAAALLDREGYPALARIVASHHNLPEQAGAEETLLYLAGKMTRETSRVSIDERFAGTKQKCGTPEALAAWERRYQRTRSALEELKRPRDPARLSYCEEVEPCQT